MARLRILKAREEGVQRLLANAHHKLADISKDQASYKKLLQSLILQVSVYNCQNDSISANTSERISFLPFISSLV